MVLKKSLLALVVLVALLLPLDGVAQSEMTEERRLLELRVSFLSRQLEDAYWHYLVYGSYEKFSEFAEEWVYEYPATERMDRERSDTLAAIYEFYSQVCAPELPKSECTPVKLRPNRYHAYYDVEYLVIDSLTLTDGDNWAIDDRKAELFKSRKRVSPFCPEHAEAQSLYLSKAYLNALDRFLGNDLERADRYNHIPERSLEESQARASALQYLFSFTSGHWGGWVYESTPRLYFIVLNDEFDRAYAEVGAPDSGTICLYEKVDGLWKSVEQLGFWFQ